MGFLGADGGVGHVHCRDFDAIAVDLRGQFGSETTSDGYDLWNQARDVQEFVDALGLPPLHIVGLSMGAMIAMRLALRKPALVRSLVLMGTTAWREEREYMKEP